MFPVLLNTRLRSTGRLFLYIAFLWMPCMAVAQEEEPVVDTTIVTIEDSVVAPVESEDYKQEDFTPVQPELRIVPDSSVNKLKRDEAFAYANDSAYWTKKAKEPVKREKGFWDYFYEFFSGSGVRTVTYIILGVIFVLIIYRIIVVNNLFMTAASRRRKEGVQELENEIDDNDFDGKIQAAIQERDFRAAIRFMYLKSLRSLNDKGWIRYHAQGTNYEYISQVHPYGVGNEFRFLTHVYEYVWYGEFALSEEQFNRVHQNFQHFFNAVRP
ncbi:DUF4129 domain-containing protein [Paraflavitalea soli]|uniref:DUF4129 domain-containing protein n=1 Tax=Paraflavitalea soli TaxID=2315862 RepID=A0A3B7MYX7_9BACT|nr:DUF4129 domain-containing protein [Paraflavitalea soli]AXY78276.1 DUF4129 domain-containing protein [Paraflavitalea soli]